MIFNNYFVFIKLDNPTMGMNTYTNFEFRGYLFVKEY